MLVTLDYDLGTYGPEKEGVLTALIFTSREMLTG